ncbi:MAG: hypothetical protein JW819_03445 [Candidatus Krumholzibacteriota bacterium]|nr:hypothetical protein [Candidatus Krumholzibacteriota bacterium]
MPQLTREARERAARFLREEARPLERALYAHRFAGGPAAAAEEALAAFRNDDGGFGRALEPDVRTPSSSALATADALRHLAALGAEPGHPLVAGAVAWLRGAFGGQAGVWRVVPVDTNDHPHAPWWHDEDGSLARIFDGFRIIPRARALAGLNHYAGLMEADWLAEQTVRAADDIAAAEDAAFGGGGDGLVYALDLARAPGLPAGRAARLIERLRAAALNVVERDPAKWGGYAALPLKVVDGPDSPLADLFADAIPANLDHLVASQAADGAWDPTWSWGGAYPEAWDAARREWRGVLTLEALTLLRAFGRLAV